MNFLQGKKLLHKENNLVSAEVALKKKNLILYYFTSLDCDSCRAFDEKLKEVYNEAIARKAEIGIIIISVDGRKEDYVSNRRANYQDWFALTFGDELNNILTYNYGITNTPALVVVRKNGTLVTKNGKQDIEEIGINVLVTWAE